MSWANFSSYPGMHMACACQGCSWFIVVFLYIPLEILEKMRLLIFLFSFFLILFFLRRRNASSFQWATLLMPCNLIFKVGGETASPQGCLYLNSLLSSPVLFPLTCKRHEDTSVSGSQNCHNACTMPRLRRFLISVWWRMRRENRGIERKDRNLEEEIIGKRERMEMEKKRKKSRKGLLEDNLVDFCLVYDIKAKFSVTPMLRAQSINVFPYCLILE